MYHHFLKGNPGTDVTYPLYKETISAFNKLAAEYILEGQTVRLGSYMGALRIKRIERKFGKNKNINWGETNKLLKQGIKKLVIFIDDYYFKWHWEKGLCKVKNRAAYKFVPTAGETGNRKKLSRFLKSDDLVQTLYKE